jgi:hypothetical protein
MKVQVWSPALQRSRGTAVDLGHTPRQPLDVAQSSSFLHEDPAGSLLSQKLSEPHRSPASHGVLRFDLGQQAEPIDPQGKQPG